MKKCKWNKKGELSLCKEASLWEEKVYEYNLKSEANYVIIHPSVKIDLTQSDLTTVKRLGYGIMVSTGYKLKGDFAVVFKFCPWCGANIQKEENQK